MKEKIFKVGDRVKINTNWRTDSVRDLVDGRTGVVIYVSHYYQDTYQVKYDAPYYFMGIKFDTDTFYSQELELI